MALDDCLVSTDWLNANLEDPGLVILDCTVWLKPAEGGGYLAVSGRADYETAHLPGAGFADLTGALCDRSSPLRFMVPPPEQFAAAMAELGVGEGRHVVLYDHNRSMWAARVWWMLRWIGFDDAALLDGGLKAWKQQNRPLVSGVAPLVAPGALTARARPQLIADRQEMLASIADGSACIIDALGDAQFRGEVDSYGRPGHLPRATNTPAIDLVDRDSGQYLPLEVLRGRFPEDPARRTITYCGGGIAASSDAFVLCRLGFTDVAVYTASLQEWVTDASNPLVVDG